VTHPERGVAILDRLAEELAEFGIVEQRPLQDGRNMTMMLGPSKAVLAGQFDKLANGAVAPEVVEAGVNGAEPPTAAAIESPTAAAIESPLAEPATNGDEPQTPSPADVAE
jgi:translation initiation factor IF-3